MNVNANTFSIGSSDELFPFSRHSKRIHAANKKPRIRKLDQNFPPL